MSDPLSVAFVSPGWPPAALANGIATYTGTLVEAMRTIGARCHVLTPRVLVDRPDPFVHLVRLNKPSVWWKVRRRFDLQGWWNRSFSDALQEELGRLKKQDSLDVLEMEESYGWAGLIGKQSPVPIVVRLHGPWFLNGIANGVARDREFQHRDSAERAGLAAATAVSAPSADVLARAREHFGLELSNASVIPNPVEPVCPDDQWRLDECEPQRIAFIGRFDRHKGGDIALEAFARILKQYPDARLDLVGPDRGVIDDSGHTWSIDKYLAEKFPAAVRQNVSYHGFLPAPQAAQVRKRALVTIVPSRYESFSLSAAEAMMAGCPLVVCGAGALLELIQHEHSGLVAKPEDADDLAEKVMSLLASPNRAAELGRDAAADAKQRYAPQVVAKQTLEFYRGVI